VDDDPDAVTVGRGIAQRRVSGHDVVIRHQEDRADAPVGLREPEEKTGPLGDGLGAGEQPDWRRHERPRIDRLLARRLSWPGGQNRQTENH
jgi:hypothetical protein